MTRNATLLRDALILGVDGCLTDGWLLMDHGTIVATGRGPEPDAATVIEIDGDLLSPGLIDLHCHGGGGRGFDEGGAAFEPALAAHRAAGTTRSLVSIASSSQERTVALLRDVADLRARDALVLGAHLEGPFLAASHRGAHALEALREPVREELEAMLAAARGALRVVTIAPELAGSSEAIALLRANGVVAAIGHTGCDAATMRRAADEGAALVSHLFNAMPPLHHRRPGPIGVALTDARLDLEIIADGVHLAPEAIRLAFASASRRVVLVSDAMAAAGHGDGRFRLGELDVRVEDGVARIDGTSTIAGSTATMASAVRHCIVEVGIEPAVALAAATANPARVLGLQDRLGRLAAGAAADVVRWGPDWRVRSVWAAGDAVPVPRPAMSGADSLPAWP